MTPTQTDERSDANQLDKQQHSVAGKEISIFSAPDVWAPYSAKEMMNFLIEYGYLEDLEGKSTLDLGTGSGIIGILCALLGAKEITLSDYSASAVMLAQKNAEDNGIQAFCIQSDRFLQFKNRQFDFIISNPPVQPWLFTDIENLEDRINGAAWNEAGVDGRLVLDALIEEGAEHLTKNGVIITSSSSRHGHRKTERMLNQYWGEENWTVIYGMEHLIDPDYHQPYMDTWLRYQDKDCDLRVYQKEASGRKFATHTDKDGYTYIITSLKPDGFEEEIPVKCMKTEEGWTILDEYNQTITHVGPDDENIPKKPLDENWYYMYYLIKISNNE